MPAENPYSSPLEMPESSLAGSLENVPEKSSLVDLAKSVFLAWEKLRIFYIVILVVVSILAISIVLAESMPLTNPELWMALIGGAVVANVCFFAGPIAETYASWLGLPTRWLRVTMFVIGTITASILAFAAIGSISH